MDKTVSLLVALIPQSTPDEEFYFCWGTYFRYQDRPAIQDRLVIYTLASAKIIRALGEWGMTEEKQENQNHPMILVVFQTSKDQINLDVASTQDVQWGESIAICVYV